MSDKDTETAEAPKKKTVRRKKVSSDLAEIEERGYERVGQSWHPREALTVGNPRALVPGSLHDANHLAHFLAKAQAVGDLRGQAPDIMYRIVQGSELGLGVCASLRHLYTVHGKVGIETIILEALARGSDRCETLRQVETPDSGYLACTWLASRRDDPEWAYVERWCIGDMEPWRPTMQQVERWPNLAEFGQRGFLGVRADQRMVYEKKRQIPMTKKSAWVGAEARMLRKRAAGDVIRSAFPDVVLGVSAVDTLRDQYGPDDYIDVEAGDSLKGDLTAAADVVEHENLTEAEQ